MDIRVHRGKGKFQHIIEIGPHQLLTDAPKLYGGEETGPEPHDLLAASLGACTALTVLMYAQRKKMDLQDIDVRIQHAQQDGVYLLKRYIHFVGELSLQDQERLMEIANKCPVHKTLSGQIQIVTEMD
jgi:putative redox protein